MPTLILKRNGKTVRSIPFVAKLPDGLELGKTVHFAAHGSTILKYYGVVKKIVTTLDNWTVHLSLTATPKAPRKNKSQTPSKKPKKR